VKPSEPLTPALVASGKLHAGMKIDGKRVDIGNFGLLQLLCKAYDVKAYQVEGPAWLKMVTVNSPRFDIVANLPEGATKEQVPEMLQNLLAERFKLKVHKMTKDQSILAMVVGKGGHKLKPAEEPGAGPEGAAPNPAVTGSSSLSVNQSKGGATVSDGAGRSQKMTVSPDGKSMRLDVNGLTMAEFAEGMTPLADRPILDMTGISGRFQMVVEISMEEVMNLARQQGAAVPPAAGGDSSVTKPAELASDPGSGSLFKAVEALGLKLEPRKSPMTMIVVDSVEKTPTEN